MAYPDNPEFIDFVDERTEPAEIEGEGHSITAGSYTYSLNEVPDTEYSISCTGDVNGSYTVSFTNTAPGSGCVYVNPLNGNVLHCAVDASDDLTWSYWGRGTANNRHMLEQYREPIEDVHKVARQFWVGATCPGSQGVNVGKGNGEIAGKLVEYNGGTRDFSSVTFENPGYYRAIRLALNSSGSLTHSEGDEASSRALCGNPPAIPESKTLAVVFLHDGVNISDSDIVNTLIEVPYHSGDPGSDGAGDVAKYQFTSGVVSGDAVCLTSPNTVSKADADDASKVPAIGFVEQILDETDCTVRSSGQFDFSGKSTSYDTLSYGQQVYLSTAAGRITHTRNETPDEWDQALGVALSSSKIQITIGAASKNKAGGGGDDPGPEGGKFKYDAGVAEGEFVYLKPDAETVNEAKADSGTTMAAIGIVDDVIDAIWLIVKNNYQWLTAEHGGAKPGGLTPGSAGDIFYISVSAEGEVQTTKSVSPEHYIQVACTQIDAGGTVFLICCGPATKPEPGDPGDGFDFDCASGVGPGHSVYLDANSVARKTDATADDKVNAKGIVKAVNAAGNRCTIVCPPNVYDNDNNYTAGEYFLNPAGAGMWGLKSTVLFVPGNWMVRIGWGRGATVGGIQVDIYNYGKLGDPGDDDGDDDKPGDDRLIGFYKADINWPVNTWVQHDNTPGYITSSDITTANQLCGVVISCDDVGGQLIVAVLQRGLHGSGYVAGQFYFAITPNGTIGPAIALGKYKKCAGIARDDGQLYVNPGPSEYLAPDGGDPVPLSNYSGQLDPTPLNNPYDKMRDWDDSTSSSKRSTNWVSKNILCELPTVAANVHFHADSVGIGTGAYALLDLCRLSDGASVLTTKAKLIGIAGAPRGNTLTEDTTYGTTAGHVAAVIDPTKLPLDPGDALYWKVTIDDGAAFSTDPYGFGIIINKYGVRG